MRNFVKRAVVFLLMAGLCMGIFPDMPVTMTVSGSTKSTDYSRYSNMVKQWYLSRASGHQPSKGAVPADELARYRAYFYDSQTKEKVIYFTFDCGYENGYTGQLLDILKKHDVKAVFFVTKHFVRSQPALCRRMKEEGHLVGNHTMNHPSLPSKSVLQIQQELRGVEQMFEEATGYQLDKYVRPPMGEFSERVLKVLQDMGYTTIFWSMAYYDYDVNRQPGKQYVIDHFKTYYHKGAIPLLHNISASNAQALDEVLTFLEEQNYQCMRLDAIGQPTDLHVAEPCWEGNTDAKNASDSVTLKFYADIKNKKLKPEGFEIYRKEKGGKYKLLAVKKANQTFHHVYRDRSVKEGKTYYYRIKAYCYRYGKKYTAAASKNMKKTIIPPVRKNFSDNFAMAEKSAASSQQLFCMQMAAPFI